MNEATRWGVAFRGGVLALTVAVVCVSLPVKAQEATARRTTLTPRLAVLGVQAQDLKDGTRQAIEDRISVEVSRWSEMDVVSSSSMKAILNLGQQQQLLGCNDEKCLEEYGSMLAVEQMVTGSISKVGKGWVVNMNRLDLVNGRSIASTSQEVKGGEDVLPGAVSAAVSTLFGVVGTIRIWNQPENGEVFLDGQLLGDTPQARIVVRTPGQHEVRIEGPGLTPWMESVEVKPGADYRLRARNQAFLDLEDAASTRRGWATGTGLSAIGTGAVSGVFWVLAMQSQRQFESMDPRIATQAELDARTGTTLTYVMTATVTTALAVALGGTATWLGMHNPPQDTLDEFGSGE